MEGVDRLHNMLLVKLLEVCHAKRPEMVGKIDIFMGLFLVQRALRRNTL